MKIINLIKCEFLKNYTLKNIIIILLVLLIATIVLVEFKEMFYTEQKYDVLSNNYYYEEICNRYNQNEDLSYKEEFELFSAQKMLEINKILASLENVTQYSWQYNILVDKHNIEQDLFVINQIKENINDSYFYNIYSSNLEYYDEYEAIIHSLYSSDINELNLKKEEKEKLKDRYDSLIEENKYYRYLEYHLENCDEPLDRLKYYQILIDNKAEDEKDYRAVNLYQYINMYFYSDDMIVSREEFNRDYNLLSLYRNYEGYVRYNKKLISNYNKNLEVIRYSLEHNIKHDIDFSNDSGIAVKYITTKIAVNQVLDLSIVVIILLVLTSGGIFSKEHSSGTEKILLTSPVKRWKVLFSKFVYLILHSYIIWLVGLVLIIIYSGIKYGFNDLFTSKLIFENGNVVEVNYLFYLLKNIVIANIPIIAFISILLFLSVITLSTSFTVGISMILAIISPLSWYIIYTFNLRFLAYTVIPYFDISLILNNFQYYLYTLKLVNVNSSLGIMISLITIFILYLISNIIYVKRDIKN